MASLAQHIPPAEREGYKNFFSRLNPQGNIVSGQAAWGLLEKSKIPVESLQRICEFADRDRDQSFTFDEFSVAFYLASFVRKGGVLPSTLPTSLFEPAPDVFASLGPNLHSFSDPKLPVPGVMKVNSEPKKSMIDTKSMAEIANGPTTVEPAPVAVASPVVPAAAPAAEGDGWEATFPSALEEEEAGREKPAAAAAPVDSHRYDDLESLMREADTPPAAAEPIQSTPPPQVAVAPVHSAIASRMQSVGGVAVLPVAPPLVASTNPGAASHLSFGGSAFPSTATSSVQPRSSQWSSLSPPPEDVTQSQPVTLPKIIPQMTGSSFQPSVMGNELSNAGVGGSGANWIIPQKARDKFAKTFAKADWKNEGAIDKTRAMEVFTLSKLPPMTVERLFALADVNRDNRLTLREFTVCMYLIHRIMKGFPLPPVLPQQLIDFASEGLSNANPSQPQQPQQLAHAPVTIDPRVGMVAQLENEAETVKLARERAETAFAEASAKTAELEEKISTLNSKISSDRRTVAEITGKLSFLSSSFEQLSKKKTELEVTLEKGSVILAHARQEAARQENSLTKLKAEVAKEESNVSAMKSEVNDITASVSAQAEIESSLEKEILDLENSLQELAVKKSKKMMELQAKSENVVGLKERKLELDSRIMISQNEIDSMPTTTTTATTVATAEKETGVMSLTDGFMIGSTSDEATSAGGALDSQPASSAKPADDPMSMFGMNSASTQPEQIDDIWDLGNNVEMKKEGEKKVVEETKSVEAGAVAVEAVLDESIFSFDDGENNIVDDDIKLSVVGQQPAIQASPSSLPQLAVVTPPTIMNDISFGESPTLEIQSSLQQQPAAAATSSKSEDDGLGAFTSFGFTPRVARPFGTTIGNNNSSNATGTVASGLSKPPTSISQSAFDDSGFGGQSGGAAASIGVIPEDDFNDAFNDGMFQNDDDDQEDEDEEPRPEPAAIIATEEPSFPQEEEISLAMAAGKSSSTVGENGVVIRRSSSHSKPPKISSAGHIPYAEELEAEQRVRPKVAQVGSAGPSSPRALDDDEVGGEKDKKDRRRRRHHRSEKERSEHRSRRREKKEEKDRKEEEGTTNSIGPTESMTTTTNTTTTTPKESQGVVGESTGGVGVGVGGGSEIPKHPLEIEEAEKKEKKERKHRSKHHRHHRSGGDKSSSSRPETPSSPQTPVSFGVSFGGNGSSADAFEVGSGGGAVGGGDGGWGGAAGEKNPFDDFGAFE